MIFKKKKLIVISCLALIVVIPLYNILKVKFEEIECQVKLKCIHSALIAYYDEYKQLPTYSKWYDLLLEYGNQDDEVLIEDVFRCPSVTKKMRIGNYVINEKNITCSNPDTVLVFEGGLGWNQMGGIEQIASPHHGGSYVLFSHGSIRFVNKKDYYLLKWDETEPNTPSYGEDGGKTEDSRQ
jgi:hypothetical protein